MFRNNLVVHHQEHGIIYCITQSGTIGTIVQASIAASTSLVGPSSYIFKVSKAVIILVKKNCPNVMSK
jgi:hypothetical protein